MRRRLLLCVLLSACDSNLPVSPDGGDSVDAGLPADQVRVAQGVLQGMASGQTWAFLGVPYAAPPTGDLRWKRPQPAAAWDGIRDATRFANTCIQISTSDRLMGGDEDCLYLNVWTPSAAPATPLPVMFWIHGGFNLNGAGSLPLYDGSYVAAHVPAVVVTINYRLGALGFANHPLLDAETPEHISGNYGHYDQLAALQWVHDNIAAFGGDPGRVLLYGASAGGSATCVLYSSPLARGLFAAAIMESGGCAGAVASGATAFDTVATNLGCQGASDELACLRGKPANDVATAYPIDLTQAGSFRWSGARVDGHLLSQSPAATLRAGSQNPVPFIVGTTADEYSTLLSHFSTNALASWDDYESEVTRLLGASRAPSVLGEYPRMSAPTPRDALIAVMTDRSMTCPARAIARAIANRGLPVRRYWFAHTYESGTVQRLGAGHYLDVPFQFHNFTANGLASGGFVPSAAELALSDRMIGYWSRFSRGDPNGGGDPQWPAYDVTADDTLVLDDVTMVQDGIRTAHCDFWDSLP